MPFFMDKNTGIRRVSGTGPLTLGLQASYVSAVSGAVSRTLKPEPVLRLDWVTESGAVQVHGRNKALTPCLQIEYTPKPSVHQDPESVMLDTDADTLTEYEKISLSYAVDCGFLSFDLDVLAAGTDLKEFYELGQVDIYAIHSATAQVSGTEFFSSIFIDEISGKKQNLIIFEEDL